jgi:hypothetical protein
MAKLIGTDPNQVPTNGDLGDLAYQNKESVKVDNLTVDGDVGIGTSSPTTKLHITDTNQFDKTDARNTAAIFIEQSGGTEGDDNTSSGITFSKINSTRPFGSIAGVQTNADTDVGGLAFYTHNSTSSSDVLQESLRIDGNGRVGIGLNNPAYTLDVAGSVRVKESSPLIRLEDSDDGASHTLIGSSDDLYITADAGNTGSGNMIFRNGGTAERMRIDSDGHLLVATTDSALYDNSVSGGHALRADGRADHARYATNSTSAVLGLNKIGASGRIAEFRQSGTEVGLIGVASNDLYIGTTDVVTSDQCYLRFAYTGVGIVPANAQGAENDNLLNLGDSVSRFNDIYATNGTIQTSDRNEKQDIEELSEAEQRVAVACKGLLRKFRWQDAVAEKGDDARIHFGIIAQDLQDAFAAEGLDAGKYAMFISSTWWETQTEVPAVEAVEAQDAVYDDEGNLVSEAVEAVEAKEAYIRTDTYDTAEEAPEGATERTRLGVRYPELLAFIIAAI